VTFLPLSSLQNPHVPSHGNKCQLDAFADAFSAPASVLMLTALKQTRSSDGAPQKRKWCPRVKVGCAFPRICWVLVGSNDQCVLSLEPNKHYLVGQPTGTDRHGRPRYIAGSVSFHNSIQHDVMVRTRRMTHLKLINNLL
jgi:hypothetical protein